MIYDDDEGILEVTKIVLENLDYETQTAMNFNRIFEHIDEFSPDLILLDLWMPDAKGEDIAKKLKHNPKYKKIPIVILSASQNTAKVAKESGADDFLCKPFNIQDLEQVVNKYLC